MLTFDNAIYCPKKWQHEAVLEYYADQLGYECSWRRQSDRAQFPYIFLRGEKWLSACRTNAIQKTVISFEVWQSCVFSPEFEPEDVSTLKSLLFVEEV